MLREARARDAVLGRAAGVDPVLDIAALDGEDPDDRNRKPRRRDAARQLRRDTEQAERNDAGLHDRCEKEQGNASRPPSCRDVGTGNSAGSESGFKQRATI